MNIIYQIKIRQIIIGICLIIFILLFSNINAQECITGVWGSATEVSCSGSTCTYDIDLCAAVPASPSPKRITYNLDYDSDNDGIVDTNVSYTYDPPGSGQIPEGTHCLSDYTSLFRITVVPNSIIEISIAGMTGAGGANSTCVIYNSTLQVRDGNLSLPVELSEFNGSLIDNEILLKWTTLSEENSSHFEIEKSIDGVDNFKMIGLVHSHHESTTEKTYQFIDKNTSLVNYYRLKMVDLDGSFEYSNIIIIENSNFNTFNFDVYPNPTKSNSTLNILHHKNTQEDIIINLLNITGQLVFSHQIQLNKGNNLIPLSLENLPEGIYFISIKKEETVYTKKIQLLKNN